MAVGVRLKFDGATQEQYDATYRHMRIESDPPKGLILHSGGPIDGDWGVIDFWESREAFDRCFAKRWQPAAEMLGSQAPPCAPEIREFPVHNITKPWLVRLGNFE